MLPPEAFHGRPLQSREAEQSVLGALLLDNAVLDRIEDKVDVADFAFENHRTIFRCIRGLVSEGKPVDWITLVEELTARGELEAAGGQEYVGLLQLNVPTAAHAEHYANLVHDRAMLRSAVAVSGEVVEAAMNPAGNSAEDVIDLAQRRFMEISEGATSSEAIEPRDILHNVVSLLEARIERGGEISGLATGLRDLDEKLSGLQPTDLVVVAGRPSMGKTSLAMGFGLEAAKSGKTVAVFSLEMSPEQLMERAVCNIGRIPSGDLRNGKISGDGWERISMAIGRLNDCKMLIDGSSSPTMSQIRARCRRVKKKHGLHLVIIDYLQLMQGEGDNRNEQISNITRAAKLLAREMGVPVILLSQLSRKCEERSDKRPMMSDLRDSGAIEQDADVILFVYRDEIYNPNTQDKGIAEIIIGKHRNGELGTVGTSFLGEYNAFVDTDWRRQAPQESQPKPRRNFNDAF